MNGALQWFKFGPSSPIKSQQGEEPNDQKDCSKCDLGLLLKLANLDSDSNRNLDKKKL